MAAATLAEAHARTQAHTHTHNVTRVLSLKTDLIQKNATVNFFYVKLLPEVFGARNDIEIF